MKKSIGLVILLFAGIIATTAQTPQAFKYQAIARDESGNVLSIWDISLRVSIKQQDTEESVYIETHKVQTNIYGLVNIVIGEGQREKGDFSDIKWGEQRHYLKIEMDIDGGNNFKEMGTTQLYAVPYALYADEAGKLRDQQVQSKEASSTQAKTGSTSNRMGNQQGFRNGDPNSKIPSTGNGFLNANSGNLGVGTTAPAEKLHVVGNLRTTGNVTAGNHMVIYDENGNPREVILKSDGTLAFRFVCEDKIIDPRDGKNYNITKIGNQCWMVQNMDLGIRIDGITDPANNSVIEKYCYGDDDDTCDIYGGLYRWNETMGYVTTEGAQGICPASWHVPTDDEWKILEGNVDSDFGVGDPVWDLPLWRGFDAGINLKSVSGWKDDGNGIDLYGFTALPGGYFNNSTDLYYELTATGYYWTSSENASQAFFRAQGDDDDNHYRDDLAKAHGLSVRCLKDFECGDSLVDYRDWKTYGTVLIDDRCWMSQNLNVGDRIDLSTPQDMNGTIEKYCYDNNEDNCDTLGGMYMWDEAMNYTSIEGDQGICPLGWHVPTQAEYDDMINYLGGSTVAGGKIKSTGTIQTGTGQWEHPNTAATNESGFSALPGGYAQSPTPFDDRGYHGYFWTSSFSGPTNVFDVTLYYDQADVGISMSMNFFAFSVRCIKNW